MADMALPERVSKRRRIKAASERPARRDTGPSFDEDRVTIVVADGLRYVQPYR